MIKILGPRAIGLIILLLLTQAILGAGVYYYLSPVREDYTNKIVGVNDEITQAKTKVAELTVQMQNLERQMARYVELKGRGFFNAQDRVTAREAVRELAILSHIMKAELKLTKGEIKEDPLASEAGHTLISGPMTLRLSAMDDIDIYRFIVALQRGFPGYLEVKNLDIQRKGDLTDVVIRALARKENETPLVEAVVDLNWWSMASDEQMKANDFFNPASSGVAQVPGAQPAAEGQPPAAEGTP